MALPFLGTPDSYNIAQQEQSRQRSIEKTTAIESIQNAIGASIPALSGVVAGVFAGSPLIGLGTAYITDQLREASRSRRQRRQARRLENRQRKAAADLLVESGQFQNRKDALAAIEEQRLKQELENIEKEKDSLVQKFGLQRREKEQQEEEKKGKGEPQPVRSDKGEGLALETTVASIDNNISAIGDLILDRFADQEQSEAEQRQLQKQQLIQQREMRLEAERKAEPVRDEGRPEKVREGEGGSGLMRLLPMLLAGLGGLVTAISGVTTSLLGTASTVLGGLGVAGAAAAGASALKKTPKPPTGAPQKAPTKPPTTVDTQPKKAPTKPTGALSKSQEKLGDQATKQSPKKGGIGDTIKKFKKVAKKVGFKRLAMLIGKRIGTTVAAGLFTGPFAIVVGLIGIGLTVYEISNILDEIDKEYEEGKAVNETQPKDVSSAELAKMSPEEAKKAGLIDFADQDDLNDRVEELRMKEQSSTPDRVETKEQFLKRRTEEILASGEADARLGSNRSFEASRRKARLMAQAEYVQQQPRTGEAITTASREQNGRGQTQANITDARSTQSTVNQVTNTNTTVQGAPLQPKSSDMTPRYSSRYN